MHIGHDPTAGGMATMHLTKRKHIHNIETDSIAIRSNDIQAWLD